MKKCIEILFYFIPASEASREVANLTKRKNSHTPVGVYGVKEFVCFLAGNNYPNSPLLHGCMKFAPKISPLLNYLAIKPHS